MKKLNHQYEFVDSEDTIANWMPRPTRRSWPTYNAPMAITLLEKDFESIIKNRLPIHESIHSQRTLSNNWIGYTFCKKIGIEFKCLRRNGFNHSNILYALFKGSIKDFYFWWKHMLYELKFRNIGGWNTVIFCRNNFIKNEHKHV